MAVTWWSHAPAARRLVSGPPTGPPSSPEPRRAPASGLWPSRRVLLGALAAVALVLACLAAYVHAMHVSTLAEKSAVAARLAHVLEAQTAGMLEAVDMVLLGIADVAAVAPPPRDHSGAFEEALRRRLTYLPFARGLFVVGPDGFIAQGSDRGTISRVSVADRGYFRVHRDDPAAGLHIEPPLVGRSTGLPFIAVSRRITRQDGRFAGVAVAAVDPRSFERFYKDLQLGERDTIALYKRDGTLLFRWPYSNDLTGKSFPTLGFVRPGLPEHGGGTFRVVSVPDGVPRIVGYRAVDHRPVVVVVGLDEHPLLASWRRFAITAFSGTTVVLSLAATVGLLLVRQARQRRELRERLAHAHGLEDLGRMTGGIAHDFNNVLNVVATNLEAVRRRAASERLPVSVDPAIRAVDQGTRLVSQLLAFARRQELTVRPLDANRRVLALMPVLGQAAGPDAVIRTDLNEDLWPCLADEAQLASAILNLIINARDAMPEGRGVIQIRTRNAPRERRPSTAALAPDDYVRVTVTDNGIGMPPSVLRRATEPLYTTKGGNMGTGLGLSQAYGFARQVGGDLLIESTVGVGTSVHLLFRRAPAGAADTGPVDDRLRGGRSRRSPDGPPAGSP